MTMANGRKTNWFAIWVSAAVVVVLVVVGIVVAVVNNQATAPGRRRPSASNIDADTGAILVGEGADMPRDLHRLHVPRLRSLRGSLRPVDRGARRRRLDHARHPPDLDPRPRVAGHRVLDPRGERHVLRRGRGRRRLAPVHDRDVREPAGRGDPRAAATSRSSRSPRASGVTDVDDCVNDGTYSKYVTDDDREDARGPAGAAASAPRRSPSTARSSPTRRATRAGRPRVAVRVAHGPLHRLTTPPAKHHFAAETSRDT